MKIRVSPEGDGFVADPYEVPGIPYVGRGKTPLEALGQFFSLYRTELGVEIEIDPSVVASKA